MGDVLLTAEVNMNQEDYRPDERPQAGEPDTMGPATAEDAEFAGETEEEPRRTDIGDFPGQYY